MREELSYVCGTSDAAPVGVALEGAAVRWPERDALICSHQGSRWSYRQLNDAAHRLAAGFWEPVPVIGLAGR